MKTIAPRPVRSFGEGRPKGVSLPSRFCIVVLAFALLLWSTPAVSSPTAYAAGNDVANQESSSLGTSAVGSTFTAPIIVGGVSIDCMYKVTSATTVQIGNGTDTAISTSAMGDLTIPATVTDSGTTYTVTALGSNCFQYCTGLTSTGLASNSTVTSLGGGAFCYCTTLTSTGLSTNTTVTTWGTFCFYECSALTSTGLGTNSVLTSLPDCCFVACSALTSTGLETNTTVTSVGVSCFENCTALTSTGLGSNSTVTSLGGDCFQGCRALTSTGLATNTKITSLGANCFQLCRSLTTTGLGSNSTVTSLGDYCFYNCTSLTSTGLAGNSTVTSLGNYCFYGCAALDSTGLDANTGVVSLGDYCFRYCDSLSGDLVIPAQVTSIGTLAFESTGFTRVYLLGDTMPTLGTDPFAFRGGQATLYVPSTFTGGSSVSDGTYTYTTAAATLVYKDSPSLSAVSYTFTSTSAATISFTLSKASVITIKDPAGTVVFSGSETAGTTSLSLTGLTSTAALTVTAQCVYPSTAAATAYNVSDVVGMDLSSATVSEIEDQNYTGKAITPTPTVVLDGMTLTEGTDYTLSYTDNVDVGTATVTVTGKGAYVGTKTIKTFKIVTSSITTFSIIKKKLYIGSALEPTPTVTYGASTLTLGTDYTLSYTSNTSRGTAIVTATAKGNYSGTALTTFKIIEFDDLDYTSWYCTGGWLSYAVENDLMSGYTGTYDFGPLDNITRGQVAVILYRYACTQDSTLEAKYGSTTDSTDYATTSVFTDEAADQYYTAAINWAKAVGIMTGDTSTGYTTVRPNDSITREDLATMVYRYVEEAEPTLAATEGSVDYSSVQEMDEVDSWAATAVDWCASYGIIGGVEKDGVCYMEPTDTAWRASMAKMITVALRDVIGWTGTTD
jgi:hypothetical protein